MKKELFWRIFIDTQKANKADKIANYFLELIGNNYEILKREKYWKDNTLFEVEFCKKIDVDSSNQLLFELLETLSLVAREWRFNLPSNFSVVNFDISGLTNEGIKITGIKWISFDLYDESGNE